MFKCSPSNQTIEGPYKTCRSGVYEQRDLKGPRSRQGTSVGVCSRRVHFEVVLYGRRMFLFARELLSKKDEKRKRFLEEKNTYRKISKKLRSQGTEHSRDEGRRTVLNPGNQLVPKGASKNFRYRKRLSNHRPRKTAYTPSFRKGGRVTKLRGEVRNVENKEYKKEAHQKRNQFRGNQAGKEEEKRYQGFGEHWPFIWREIGGKTETGHV